MYSFSKPISLICLPLAILTLMLIGCSNSDIETKGGSVSTDDPGSFDEIGPEEDLGDAAPSELFVFDDSAPSTTYSGTSNIGPDGGTVSVLCGSNYHSVTFSPGKFATEKEVELGIEMGVNTEGNKLTVYSISPIYAGYEGEYAVLIETGIDSPRIDAIDYDFTLYKWYQGEFYETSRGFLGDDGVVSFTLSNASNFAVITVENKGSGGRNFN
jgi:hypothetical protein